MSPLSLFFSNINVSQRIESFREAEARLLEYAKTRFHPISQSPHSHSQYDSHDASNHDFELIDTPITPPSVVHSGGGSNSIDDCKMGELVGEGGCMGKSSASSSSPAQCQLFGKDGEENGKSYRIHGIKVVNRKLSSLGDDEGNINKNDGPKNPAPLVLLHGYANGSLYFYRNLMQLSHYHFPTIYALDMLGWGLSSRPDFAPVLIRSRGGNSGDAKSTKSKRNNIDENTETSQLQPDDQTKHKVSTNESFFVESLESWRQQHNLPKLTLAGHSMGGYLSVAYAEKYPQHVERLILLSPVGVPQRSEEDDSKNQKRMNSMPLYVRMMVNTVRYLFDKGITPGSFLRSLPHSKSKAMVDSYVLNRLPAIDCDNERSVLSEYLYQNSMMPGSGEYALAGILMNDAFARIPLVHRIPKLVNCDDGDGMEVHFIYGENDWMDYKGGLEVQRQCWKKRLEWKKTVDQKIQSKKEVRKVQQLESLEDECKDNNVNTIDSSKEVLPPPPPKVFVHGVRNAGHLLMLDNYKEFNAAVIIAAGGEGKLPSGMPRPVEFVCSEMMAGSHASSRSASGGSDIRIFDRLVMSEEDAAMFFRGGHWNRR
ncbi:hypothetical protein ACHAXS_002016, partial [Conticribra weissflogii]